MCLHEGKKGWSIDPIFIRRLLKSLDPAWIRPWQGNHTIRAINSREKRVDLEVPAELQACLEMGGNTTLMAWADLDDDINNGEELKARFWTAAQENGITRDQFDQVVFAFAKDRIENWIEFLLTGTTDGKRERSTANAR